MTDIEKLRELAEKATKGPWSWDPFEVKPGDLGEDQYAIFETGEDDPALAYVGPWADAKANAAYIAATNPSAVIELLDEITRLRGQVVRMRGAFTDAIDTVDFWAAYASDYFKDKHDLEGDLARLRAARAAMEG